MGCTQSKIDQDEAITRCKDRKHYLAIAVSARNAFAAAHSSYSVSLKNTGAALYDYTLAEIPLVSTTDSNTATSAAVNLNTAVPNSISIHAPIDLLPPPPPLPADIPPLQRSVSMPDIPLPQQVKKPPAGPSIREEDEEADDEGEEEEEEDEEEEEEVR